MPNPETDWNHGDVVRDREDDDPDPAIVVNTPGAPADEWDISRLDKTVAEDNPEYPSDAEIITVVFEENLNEAFPNWEANNPITYATLEERNIQHYSFPDPRLEPAEPTDANYSRLTVIHHAHISVASELGSDLCLRPFSLRSWR
ncbi:hypothetical protein GCM10008985_30710 [Halococcus dombrowskii]|uniref:Uncharacterized protein n=1 Tax=Halococcus dombrowskii TaxID=179637 RepID=A0AAV3SJ56_HALDO